MGPGDKLLAGIEANKLFLKKHLSRKRVMKTSYGISTLIYLIVLTLLVVLTTQAYNLYKISDVISNDGGIQSLTNTSLATIKSELGVNIDDKLLLLGFTIFFALLFLTTLSFYISLSKMNYTARPKLWLGTSIVLLPLIVPFIMCVIVFLEYIKDKNWKENRKDVKKTIEPILSSVIKEFEDDVLQKEVNVKRVSNEHPGFENIYESLNVDKNFKTEQKQLEPSKVEKEDKPKKLTRKEKKALKKQEKVDSKQEKIKVDESQIVDEITTETPTETPTETES